MNRRNTFAIAAFLVVLSFLLAGWAFRQLESGAHSHSLVRFACGDLPAPEQYSRECKQLDRKVREMTDTLTLDAALWGGLSVASAVAAIAMFRRKRNA